MGSRDVGRESLAFIQPIGLSVFANHILARFLRSANDFANVSDLFAKLLSYAPVGLDELIDIQLERSGVENLEIEFVFFEETFLDRFSIGPEFGLRERIEKTIPIVLADLACVLNDATGAIGFLLQLASKVFFGAEQVGVVDLKLAHFI